MKRPSAFDRAIKQLTREAIAESLREIEAAFRERWGS